MASAIMVVLKKKKEEEEKKEQARLDSIGENSMRQLVNDEGDLSNRAAAPETVNEAGGNVEDTTVIQELYLRVLDITELRRSYVRLGAFFVFTILYMAVLYLQQQSFRTYGVATAHKGLLPQDSFMFDGGIPDIYSWLNDSIINVIYTDPVCGDGVCEQPQEYPGFGSFGCQADCGALANVTNVTATFNTQFTSLQDMSSSSWNLCLTSPTQLCWYDKPQPFGPSLVQQSTVTFAIPDGDWQIVITAPNGGVSGSMAPQQANNADTSSGIGFQYAGIGHAKTFLATWGGCAERNNSVLASCRTTCARFGVCSMLACSNINIRGLSQITVDCYQVCDSNATLINSQYSNASCLEVAEIIKNGSSFLTVYKEFTLCDLDPNYNGSSPDNGLNGYVFNASGNIIFPSNQTVKAKVNGRSLLQHELLVADESNSNRRELEEEVGDEAYLPDEAEDFSSHGVAERRRLSGIYDIADVTVNGTNITSMPDPPPELWFSLAASNTSRLEVLQAAVARTLFSWPGDACSARNPIRPYVNTTRWVAFFCAYLGGPYDLPGCNYTDYNTGQQLNHTIDLAKAMQSRHASYNHGQDEEDSFISLFINSLTSVATFPPDALLTLRNWLHLLDPAIVTSPTSQCNTVDVTLPWAVGSHYNTTIQAGDTIQWVWTDDEAHSVREVKIGDGPYADFIGFGSGRLILSKGTSCTFNNIGDVGALTPLPCSVEDPRLASSSNAFQYSWTFKEPGTYYYECGRHGTLMTGQVTVQPLLADNLVVGEGRPLVEQVECAPGCPLWRIRNGLCKDDCNVADCAFDGGDCSCDSASASSGGCSCWPGQIRDATGACCEPTTLGTDLGFNFTMHQYGNDSLAVDSIFLPPKNFDRTRIYNLKNRLVIGMLIHQVRGESKNCSSQRFKGIYPQCSNKRKSTEPFGVDPVFLPSSDLYNPNISASDFYSENELNRKGVPLGFFHESMEGYPKGFPLIFDLNLGNKEAIHRLQYMIDGFYLDNNTQSLTVQIITYNGNEGSFANTEVLCTFQSGGKLAVQWSLNAISVQLYHSTQDYVRAVLEIILLLSIIYNVFTEVVEWIRHFHNEKNPFAYFRNPWNFIDLLSLAIVLACAILWIKQLVLAALPFKILSRYNIYDLNAIARYWALSPSPAGFKAATSRFQAVHDMIAARQLYMALNGINLFLTMLRVLKELDFQPRMGIITRTLSAAAPELLHFALLFGIVFTTYSLLGHLVFGHVLDQYRSMAIAMSTNFNIIMGDNSVVYDLILLQGWELVTGQIFFWTFVILSVFILLNFLIAIVVDAFTDAKAGSSTAASLPAEVSQQVKEWMEVLFRTRVDDKKLLEQLEAWGGRKPLDWEAELAAQKKGTEVPAPTVVKLGYKNENEGNLATQEIDSETLQSILERSNQLKGSNPSKLGLRRRSISPATARAALLARFGETGSNDDDDLKHKDSKAPKRRFSGEELRLVLEAIHRKLSRIESTAKMHDIQLNDDDREASALVNNRNASTGSHGSERYRSIFH